MENRRNDVEGRENKRKWERASLFCIFVLLCFLLYQNIDDAGVYVSARTRFNMSMELESLRSETDLLRAYRDNLQKKLDESQYALNDLKIQYEDVLQKELSEYEALAGKTDLYGQGIILFVQDGMREPKEGESIANYIIHDLDLQIIVDELRNAGAEAISINGERVMYNKSAIKCVGPVIMIGGRQVAPPFEIRAIGNRNELAASMNAPGGFIELLRGWSIQVEIDTAMYIEIPKYKGE